MSAEDQWRGLLHHVRRRSAEVNENEIAAVAVGLGLTVAPNMVGCSITEARPAGYQTPVASNQLALELDLAQYAARTGPCVDAAVEGKVHHLESISEPGRYARFAAAASARGVRSSYSVPLLRADRAAALNLYASEAGAFRSPQSQAVAQLLGRCITSAATHPSIDPRLDAVQIQTAREQGQLVRRAQALLASRMRISESAAYRRLVDQATAAGQSLADTAGQVISRCVATAVEDG